MLALAAVVLVLFGGPEPKASGASPDWRPAAAPQANPEAAGRQSNPWRHAQASYYLPTGNRTACGLPMTMSSWYVASLKPSTAKCGLRVVICHRHRCVAVRVQDRGAWRTDSRRWDLTPRVKRALRCGDLCNVTWKRARR